MKRYQAMLLPLGLVLAATVGVAGAQNASGDSTKSRAEVKMETKEFLKTHQWDATNEAWMVKPDVAPPSGVRSRAEVKAERDAWLKNHQWDEKNGAWMQLDKPRDMSHLSREQVKMETKMFLKTHTYDEESGAWKEAK